MQNRLYQLWFLDHRARARIYFASAFVAFCYGVIANMAFGRPENQVTWEALGVVGLIVLGSTIVYCVRRERSETLPQRVTTLAVLALSAAAALLVVSTALPAISPEIPATMESYRLTTIRETLQTAESRHDVLPPSQIRQYKKNIRATASTATEYWSTIATVVNYESLLNQMNGGAPDPTKVAKSCFGEFTGNIVSGGELSNCVIDLDTNSFQNFTFKDSVVRYHGGPLFLRNVRFVNCRFELELRNQKTTPSDPQLLEALFNSENQTFITIRE